MRVHCEKMQLKLASDNDSKPIRYLHISKTLFNQIRKVWKGSETGSANVSISLSPPLPGTFLSVQLWGVAAAAFSDYLKTNREVIEPLFLTVSRFLGSVCELKFPQANMIFNSDRSNPNGIADRQQTHRRRHTQKHTHVQGISYVKRCIRIQKTEGQTRRQATRLDKQTERQIN